MPGFYVWQRDWNSFVKNAVQACPRELYVLAAEFTGDNRPLKIESVRLPDDISRRTDITLTYRIHVELLEPCPAERIAAEIRKYPAPMIQLDVDCPEKKLALYDRLLVRLQKLLPERRISITALPCHLNQPAFKTLAAKADYYVLQVHGLNIPTHHNDDRRLIRREDAMSAIDRAEKLGLPFKVALPTYAYQLNFDRQSGRFLSLNAERKPFPSATVISSLTTIDFNLLHDILFHNPTLNIIWFRLPVETDTLNWDMTTITALEQGKNPVPEVNAYDRKNGENRIDLMIRTEAAFGFGTVRVKLTWPQKTGEFDLFGGTVNRSANCGFAVLPEVLEVPLPGCGKEVRAASFFINTKPIKVEIE